MPAETPTRVLRTEVEYAPPKKNVDLHSFVNFIAQTMPDGQEMNSFLNGTVYAELATDYFFDGEEISLENIRRFVAKMTHASYDTHKKFDFVDIVESRNGKDFLLQGLPLNNAKYEDIANHFKIQFEGNTYAQLGAFMVLALREGSDEPTDQTQPRELEPNLAFPLSA